MKQSSSSPHRSADEVEADILIARKKVEEYRKNGILIDGDTPYNHSSTRGGKLAAFIPRRIRSGNSLWGFLILVLIILIGEALRRMF